MSSGLRSQLGIAAETTYGTRVTVNRFVPFVDESVTQEIARMQAAGIIAGARVLRSSQWAPGATTIGGDIGMELYQQSMGLLFEHMLGSITSSFTSGVGTHTVTPGDLTGKSLTVQFGRPDVAGTVQPFTYAGVKIASWEIKVAAGEIATLGLTVVAQTETTGVTLATASYADGSDRPFHYLNGTVSISGSAVCVRELSLTGENPLEQERRCIGQQFIDQPLENELRGYGGTATLEFSGLTQYNRFVQGTEFPIVLSLSASASAQATFTLNARFDGQTPYVSGRDLLVVDVPFVCVASTTQDSSALSLTLKTASSTP